MLDIFYFMSKVEIVSDGSANGTSVTVNGQLIPVARIQWNLGAGVDGENSLTLEIPRSSYTVKLTGDMKEVQPANPNV